MSLRTRVIPSILNGVSKQPPLLRAADQMEDEVNTWASLASGLSKRPPAEHVAKVLNSLSDSAFVHYINRDTTERYFLVIEGGTIKVFDTSDGTEVPVAAPHGFGYLTGGEYRAVTVADYTFVVNTKRTCALDAPGSDGVADPATFQTVARGAEVVVYPPNPSAPNYVGEVATLTKLPETAPNGSVYKVGRTSDTAFGDYYVIRNGAVWDETVQPGLQNALDSLTMPHALVREANGTFTFAPFSWAPRRVGDATSNPAPTFVGQTISDVFFYQNRLGFLTGENVVFSCTGDFGNFWRNTVLDYVDSDVIDAATATTSVSLLRFALPFNDGIMAFADQTQFAIENGEQGLTPASLAISPVTRYEINRRARPVAIGTDAYFCGNQDGGTAVWEYTRLAQGDSLIAADITAHVPGYVPADIRQIVAAPNERALFAVTGTKDVYVYQFFWNGNEKALSAWRKWTFEYPVVTAGYADGSLFILVRRPDGAYLQRVRLGDGEKPAEQNEQVFLDARYEVLGTYDSVSDRTTFVLPFAPAQSAFRMVRSRFHATRPGSLVDPSTHQWTAANVVRVPGNEAAVTVTAGESYLQSLTFSRQFPLDYQGRPLQTGRLQLRTFTIGYANTAYFKTEVRPYGDALPPDVEEVVPAKLAEFTGKVVGANSLRLNRPVYHTGSYSFQVYGDAAQAVITITNDTHCAATFVSAEWEGFWFNRASQ